MRIRIVILVVALLLGGLAAVMAARYLTSARSEIEAESQPIEVLVAQEDIPRGLPAEELLAKDLIVLQEIPQRFVAAGAISSEKALEGRVLAAPLSSGEQVTSSRFQLPSTAGLAYSIPAEFMALSIPVDEVKGVSGLVKPGDHVALYVSFGQDENAITRLLVPDVKVLAVGARLTGESDVPNDTGGGGLTATRQEREETLDTRTMTLAISSVDAERIVFAEEEGRVWCALLPATAQEIPVGTGQTLQTIFK